MWQKSTSRRFGLAINPTVSFEEARDCLRDHELILKLFYGSASINRGDDETGSGSGVVPDNTNTATFIMTFNNSKTRVQFENHDLGVLVREHIELGIDVQTQWDVLLSDSDRCSTGMLLVENTKIEVPRLVSIVLPVKVNETVSLKTHLLTAAMEIRHRQPNITRDALVQQAKELVVGMNLQSQPT